MFRKRAFLSPSVFVLVWVFAASVSYAQTVDMGRHSRARITQNIDEGKPFRLAGNTRREANAENDRGAVADDFRVEHMQLQLHRSSDQEQALQQFIEELQSPNFTNFHKWLTAQEFGDRYGVAQQDLDTLT